MNKKNSTAFLQGVNYQKKEFDKVVAEKDRQIKELKRLISCKHLRVHSERVENGYNCGCLTCGHLWFEKDKPLTDAEKISKQLFEGWQRHNKYREGRGLKRLNAE